VEGGFAFRFGLAVVSRLELKRCPSCRFLSATDENAYLLALESAPQAKSIELYRIDFEAKVHLLGSFSTPFRRGMILEAPSQLLFLDTEGLAAGKVAIRQLSLDGSSTQLGLADDAPDLRFVSSASSGPGLLASKEGWLPIEGEGFAPLR